jgi:hypothetical protein
MSDTMDTFDGGRAAAAAAAAAAGTAEIRVPGGSADGAPRPLSDAEKLKLLSERAAQPDAPGTLPEPPSARPVAADRAVPSSPSPAPASATTAEDAARRMAALFGGGASVPTVPTPPTVVSVSDQAPPLERRSEPKAPEPVAAPASAAEIGPAARERRSEAKPPATASTAHEPPPLDRHAGAASADACRVVESRDGIRLWWEVCLPSGGGAVVILTPRRSPGGVAGTRPLPAHVTWRGADAVAAGDVKAFARTLAQAADTAESLPPALLD